MKIYVNMFAFYVELPVSADIQSGVPTSKNGQRTVFFAPYLNNDSYNMKRFNQMPNIYNIFTYILTY